VESRQHHVIYEGIALSEVGRYSEALTKFEEADSLQPHEAPSYDALPYIAEMQCRLGEYDQGLQVLTDLFCALDIDRGKTPCFLDSVSLGPNPALTEECFDRMCSELFLSYYENPTAEQLHHVDRVEGLAIQVRELCEEGVEKEASGRDE
jgi:tetratricopeptide (TPR) repeat protein